jgi:hypothetical protein
VRRLTCQRSSALLPEAEANQNRALRASPPPARLTGRQWRPGKGSGCGSIPCRRLGQSFASGSTFTWPRRLRSRCWRGGVVSPEGPHRILGLVSQGLEPPCVRGASAPETHVFWPLSSRLPTVPSDGATGRGAWTAWRAGGQKSQRHLTVRASRGLVVGSGGPSCIKGRGGNSPKRSR